MILQIKNPDRKLHPDDLPATDSQSASDRRCPLSNGSRKVRQLYGFFPSYQYLDEVAEAFHHAYPTIKMLVQDTAMNETERENF